jgi:uncharacterized damage-inducible protein DinB
MSHSDSIVREFSLESANTRKLLERVPDDKLSWKPHTKSMTLSRLATHVSELPSWGDVIVNNDFFDMAAVEFKPVELETRSALLELFDKNVDVFKNALKGKSDDELRKTWQLKAGDKVLIELPRLAAIRSFILSHAIHHRGQLTVYLRLNDVPLPAIYGPSADDTGSH